MSFRRPAIGFVLTCVLLDALGIGLIIPVLPRLIGTLAETRDLQTAWYGTIMLGYGLMQFCCAPVVGAVSDRIGRRPVLLIGIFGLGLMMAVPALTDSLWCILLSRVAGGILSSNIVVAQAYIADVTPAEKRTAAFGRIGAIFGIAFVFGPALGGILGEADPRVPFFCAAAICTANFLFGLFVLPESLRNPNPQPFGWRALNPFATLASLVRERFFLTILAIVTLYTLSQSLMQCTWALYTEFRYGWTPRSIGLSIFALGAAITLTQGVLLPRLLVRLSMRKLVFSGLLVGFLALVGLGLSTSGTLASLLVCLFAVMGVVGPALQGLVSRASAPGMQGARLGALSSVNSFTGAVSPMIGTPLLFYTVHHAPDSLAAGTPYFLAALLVLAALAIACLSRFDDPTAG